MAKSLEAKRRAAAEASRRWREKHPVQAKQVERDAYHRRQAKDGKPSKPRVTPTPEEKKARARERQREWRAKNRERANELGRNFYRRNKETLAAISAEWQRQNKDRVRATYLKRKYGLTPEQYDALGTCCAICGATEGNKRVNGDGKAYRLFVDHDHGTGKVCGLLCFACNVAIGYLDHNVERLLSAVAYLKATA